MTAGIQFLQSTRLTAMIQALEDVRLLPAPLKMSQRVLDSDSWDGEIIARDLARVLIADIIADDSRAVTYQTGKLWTETFQIPNLKVGVNFTQEQINQIDSISKSGGFNASGSTIYGNGRGNLLDTIVKNRLRMIELGIMQRRESLIIAMMTDAFAYDRLGVKITGSWGMPTELKTALVGTATWDNPTTARPIHDMLVKKQYASVRFGRDYNRATMSTTDFLYMVATDEFKTEARSVTNTWGPWGGGSSSVPVERLDLMGSIFEQLTGLQLERYDAHVWEQQEDGDVLHKALYPVGTVTFSNRDDDGNTEVMDVADAVVTESIVGGLLGSGFGNTVGNIPQGQHGPLAYATGDLNPPQFTIWGVKRCFPRKKDVTATATLKVGSYTDIFPVTEVTMV